MRLPGPVIGVLFPAQRYMRRQRDEWLRERIQRPGPSQPEPATLADGGQAAPDEAAARSRARAAREHRLAMIERIARDQEQLLRSKADELERVGAVELTTAAGEIRARIIRFRWGADVIEIASSRGAGRRGWNRSLLARSPAPDRAEQIRHLLAYALAALEPPPPAPEG